jgi:crotonobetainyl-CoA:carnitine CoA-transferase CaiB-like acyl-CoA transferase
MADLGAGGMMSAIAILAAIIHRENREGQRLDVSMLDGVISGSPSTPENILWIVNFRSEEKCS